VISMPKLEKSRGKGWFNESERHSLASRTGKAGGEYRSRPNERFYINSFLEEIDYKNAKREYSYILIDGKLSKITGRKGRVITHDVIKEFKSNEIEYIHNHPYENPPSNDDIFNFLYSGKVKRSSVITPSGKMYSMKRNPETRSLTYISSKKIKEAKITDAVIDNVNADKRRARMAFGRSYNGYLRTHIKKMGITTNAGIKKNTPELQERALKSMAKFNNFDLQITNI